MNEEEKKAIKSMKEFAYTIHGTLSIKEAQTVLNLLEKKDKEIQFQKEINKTEQNRHKQTEKSLKGQLQKKDKIIDELSTMVFDSRNLTFVDYKQFKDRKKEIIKYAEEQATGKAM